MGDVLAFLVMIYGVVTVFLFFMFASTWNSDRKKSWAAPAEQRWLARMALLAPLWPLLALRFLVPLLARRLGRIPGSFGSTVGEFMVDATRGKSYDDE